MSIDTKRHLFVQQPDRVSDVELLFCMVPAAHDVLPLLDLVSDWETPVEQRSPEVPVLVELVARERAMTSTRWTPHYDGALAKLAVASDRELLEPCWTYPPCESGAFYASEPYDRWTGVRRQLATHSRLCDQFAVAESRGARTLADAFDRVVIGSDQLADWFALHPDPEALDRRLRRAAHAYLAATPPGGSLAEIDADLIAAVVGGRSPTEVHYRRMVWHGVDPTVERRCAMSIFTADLPSQLDFTHVPLQVLEWLGNPFAPLC